MPMIKSIKDKRYRLPIAPRYVGMCDVLGFSDLVESQELVDVYFRYWKLLESARIHMKTYSTPQISGGSVSMKDNYAIFSDTLLLWSDDLSPPYDGAELVIVSNFFSLCASLIQTSILLDLPLRVGVAYGEVFIDAARSVFLGKPIVNAYKIEESQKWIGGACHSSCTDGPCFDRVIYPWTDVLEYPVPYEGEEGPIRYAINWPSGSLEKIREKLQLASANHSHTKVVELKYSNSIQFFDYAATFENRSFQEEAKLMEKYHYKVSTSNHAGEPDGKKYSGFHKKIS